MHAAVGRGLAAGNGVRSVWQFMKMKLFAGCYERFLFSIDVSYGNDSVEVRQSSSQPAHRSAVKCIASRGDYVATGGADDQIHLFDMVAEKDLGFVVNPVEGPVPCLSFVSPDDCKQPTHFLSGAHRRC